MKKQLLVQALTSIAIDHYYQDYDGRVFRMHAIEALGEIGDSRAVDPLIKILRRGYSEQPDVRRAVIKCLGGFRDARAVSALTQVLKNVYENKTEACEAIKTLGEIQDAKAVEALVNLLRVNDLEIVCAALTSLDGVKDVDTIPMAPLKRSLYDFAFKKSYDCIKIPARASQTLIG